jgi:hypothetical protein
MHSVLLAALIILVFQPGFVWDTGFQLSFIAVAAIILAARRLPRLPAQRTVRDPQWWRVRLLQFAGIQGVVSFTMAPMTALHFQEIHLAGLVTNFFLIPIASILVPLTFLMSCFAVAVDFFRLLWLEPVLSAVATAPEFLASAMIGVARLGAAIPGATLSVPGPSALQIAVFLAALTAALGLRKSALRRAGWTAAAFSVLLIAIPKLPSSPAPTSQSTLLLPDAGRKNAFFIRLPDGRGYAVDGNRRSRARFDMWRNVLAPLLRNQRENTWEGLFLLAQSGLGGSAEKQLAIGMSLARVMEVARGGAVSLRAPGNAGAEALSPATGGRSPVLWRTESGPARLSLKRFGGGHLAFELEHGEARWLIALASGRGRINRQSLPWGRYDLVRLPERMLREEAVLGWLEEIQPYAVIASPQGVRRLPLDKWRHLRGRQRALGLYRPWRGGMVRAATSGGALGRGGRIERSRRRSNFAEKK